jgi:pyruvate dehydrogenase E2 component (dihydrolipoamide acetyltransferase)
MPIEVLMPALSPTMKEGNLAKWNKKEGDKIKAGEVIAEIETDKATMEVEAVDEGTLGKILIAEGTENVAVNSCIALILEEGESADVLKSYVSSQQNAAKQENKSPLSEEKSKNPSLSPSSTDNSSSGNNSSANTAKILTDDPAQIVNKNQVDDAKIKASPLAKRIAKDSQVSLALVSGSGPKGRIVKKDVLEFLENPRSSGVNSGMVLRNSEEFYAIKNSNIRKVIARRLLESKQSVPHFYLSCEFRVDKLHEIRLAINEAAELDANNNPTFKVSINDLLIKACAMALKKVPLANSSWSDDAILVYNNIDISMAVAIDGGLITPIIRNADQKTIQQISSESKQLVKKAREGKLQPEEFQGGSFSISNLGMFGIDNFSAIVNPPQSCILAVSQSVKKPVVENNQIVIGTLMNVCLSCDHRSVDGAVGAEFLKALRRYVENPVLNLL